MSPVPKRRFVLNESTPVSLSMLVLLLGGAAWLFAVAAKGDANAKDVESAEKHISTVEARVADQSQVQQEMRARLERIDVQVQFLYDSARRRAGRE